MNLSTGSIKHGIFMRLHFRECQLHAVVYVTVLLCLSYMFTLCGFGHMYCRVMFILVFILPVLFDKIRVTIVRHSYPRPLYHLISTCFVSMRSVVPHVLVSAA